MKHKDLPPLDAAQRYTVEESCDYLRTSRASLYAKIADGRVPVVKDGRRTYVPGTAIIALSRVTQ